MKFSGTDDSDTPGCLFGAKNGNFMPGQLDDFALYGKLVEQI